MGELSILSNEVKRYLPGKVISVRTQRCRRRRNEAKFFVRMRVRRSKGKTDQVSKEFVIPHEVV